jgi:hypothetical protein
LQGTRLREVLEELVGQRGLQSPLLVAAGAPTTDALCSPPKAGSQNGISQTAVLGIDTVALLKRDLLREVQKGRQHPQLLAEMLDRLKNGEPSRAQSDGVQQPEGQQRGTHAPASEHGQQPGASKLPLLPALLTVGSGQGG